MNTEKLYNHFVEFAGTCGMIEKRNAILRKNIKEATDGDGASYFGLIRPDQETSGPYSGFSLVVFPASSEAGPCIIALTVGSTSFDSDSQLATMPGVRRKFQSLITAQKAELAKLSTNEGDTDDAPQSFFIKADFQDLQSSPEKEFFMSLSSKSKVPEKYGKLLPAAVVIDTAKDEALSLKILEQWIAAYADMREWGTKKQQDTIRKTLPKATPDNDQYDKIKALLLARHYVVLQGAPGVGKTYTARKLAQKENFLPVFQQFHAATTYSDFVCGIEPTLTGDKAGFRRTEGSLLQAIKKAKAHPQQNVLLIIDEINRANLSNVLGPVFYLFEPSAIGTSHGYELAIGDERIAAMPTNLYVLATMNTADRSLAVVDFALRRRFAWYTIPALPITPDKDHTFYDLQFSEIDAIFKKYATDQELNLQPGPSYFLTEETNKKAADKKDANVSEVFKDKMRYELMPLLKEYFEEGYMLPARDAIVSYFLKFGIQMYL